MRRLQAAFDEPFLHLSSDQLVDGGAVPERREATGPFDWVGSMRPRFFDGGRAHLAENRIHDLGRYDLSVDTTAGITAALVAAVIDAWSARPPVGALFDP